MSTFPPIAFQSSLSTEAILFGVFGFLYSIYGMYSNPSSAVNLQRPPIVQRIKRVCQAITGLIIFNACLTILSLILLFRTEASSDPWNIILAIGFALTMVAIAIISGIWVFRYME